jgi:Phage tail sheath C-terminal domain
MTPPMHRLRARLALALIVVAALGVALAAPTDADTTTATSTTSTTMTDDSAPAAPTTAAPSPLTAQITGAASGVPLFIIEGTASDAPAGTAISVTSISELPQLVDDPSPELSLAVEQFFDLGGSRAYLWLTPDEQAATLVAATTEIARAAPPTDVFVIPGIGALQGQDYLDVATALAALADAQLGVALLDPPTTVVAAVQAAWPDVSALVDLSQELQSAIAEPSSAALYATPLTDEATGQTVPAGVVMAGLIARRDIETGVWAPPAGIDLAATGLEVVLPVTNSQVETFGRSVNVFIDLPNYGTVAWGDHTLDGKDFDGQYLSVVRTLDWIQRSVTASLGWVVFEPDNPATQAAVGQAVSSFLTALWKQGALMGATASDSFQVSVGPDPTTSDQAPVQGIELRIGLALLRPAEFISIVMNIPTGSG